MDRAREAAAALRFNPDVTALADRILGSILRGGGGAFNGIHLRCGPHAAVRA